VHGGSAHNGAAFYAGSSAHGGKEFFKGAAEASAAAAATGQDRSWHGGALNNPMGLADKSVGRGAIPPQSTLSSLTEDLVE